jgi:hypothetical protein
MSPRDLLQRVRQRPFNPFRLVVSEGATYEVRHPEQVMVARDSAVIGLLGVGPDQGFYETTVLVDLIHVVRLEPLAAAKPAGDGAGS